jgi:hypothetical protein
VISHVEVEVGRAVAARYASNAVSISFCGSPSDSRTQARLSAMNRDQDQRSERGEVEKKTEDGTRDGTRVRGAAGPAHMP